jgi:asparagine synthase (glutamine-hydrolysing)
MAENRGWCGWFHSHVAEDTLNKVEQQLNGGFSTERQVVSKQTNYWSLVVPEQFYEDADPIILITSDPIADKKCIVEEYRNKGIGVLKDEQLAQASLILIDREKDYLFLRTDPIGLEQIYYARTQEGLIFADRASLIIQHPEISDEISVQSIYDYIYYHHCPSPGTIYLQVRKLEGGQLLSFKENQVSIESYWVPDFKIEHNRSNDDLGAELIEKLVEVVRKHSPDPDTVGAFLSGGLDSSSVAGALARVFPGKAKTFSMGFPVEGYDEIEFAHMAVNHFKTRQHEYYITPEDTVDAIPNIATYYDEPFGNSSALAAYYCAKLARDNGIEVMLAGDGGDELFAGNERYAKQLLFEPYQKVPSLLRFGLEGTLASLPNAMADKSLFHKAKRYIEQAKTPMPDRLQDYNFLHRHVAQDIFQADFLSQIDLHEPLQILRDTYNRPQQADTLNRMLYLDWKSTLHDNDLVKVNRMCHMVGVDVRYPILDMEIVKLSMQVPSNFKIKGQNLRWFYKQAVSQFLPDGIINKSKHGFGLPFGVWLKDHKPLQDMAYQAIVDLKKRPYFKPEFLEHAIEMHQSIHAAYYGELIWILMMLELWLQSRR